MKNALATAALAAILSTGATLSASAMPVAAPVAGAAETVPVELAGHRGKQFRHGGKQLRHGRHQILPRQVIRRSLRHKGFRNIRNIHRVRGDYVLHARGYRGPVRLVVDGRTARILSRQRLHRGGHRSGLWLQGGNGNFFYSLGIR